MIRQTTSEPLPQPAVQPLRRNQHPLQDHYIALVQQLQTLAEDRPSFVVGVTSCESGEGVSTVAANLAVTSAASGQSTLLIDANTTRPAAAGLFQLSAGPGLSELLSDTEPDDCLREAGHPGLTVLTAGDTEGAVIHVTRFTEAIEMFKQRYGLIIVDLPAADELSPAAALAGRLDGTLLVVEAERVQGSELRRGKHRLESAEAKVLGVVMNKRRGR